MVLCGKGGGAGLEEGSPTVEVLVGRGGIEGLAGIVSFGVSDATVLLAGRFGGGGGALLPAFGGGAWKFFCLLRAATLSANVVNCGSSTSPMVS